MKKLLLAGLLGMLSVPLQTQADCQKFQNPMQPILEQLRRDTDQIFKAVASSEEVRREVTTTDEDLLIVPGSRVGSFEIGASVEAIRSKLGIPKPETGMEDRYLDVLPISYIPPRLFSEDTLMHLRFAFSQSDSKLTEIFVQNDKFKTAEEIHVGSPVSSLKRIKGLKLKKKKDVSYYLGDGITFVGRSNNIVEVIVFKRKAAM